MSPESRTFNLASTVGWSKSIVRQISYWLALILMGYLASHIALALVSLADSGRLVSISAVSILQAIPLILFLYFTGAALVIYLSNIPNCIGLFTIAFLLRVGIAIFLTLIFQFDDERGFHIAGVEQAYGLFSWGAGRGYYHLVNILYAVFGPNLLLPKVLNALLGSLLPFFAYDLGRRLFGDPKAAWRAFLFTAFLPPLVVFSAVNLKEIATAFLLVLTLWFLIVPRRRCVVWEIIGGAVSMGALYWLRGAPWVAIALAGVVTYIILGETWSLRYTARIRFLFNLFLIGLLVFFASPFLIEPIHEIVLSRLTQETYFIERFADSSATVTQFVDTSNSLSPKNVVVLFLRGFYSPSPIRLLFDFGLSTIIEAFNVMIWYVLFPFAMAGFLAERHKGAVVACGVAALGVLAMATVGVMVGSDPYRHRVTMMGLLFTLAGGGFKREVFRRYRWVFYLWWTGAMLFTAVWIVFRV